MPDTFWNYRVIESDAGGGEKLYAIHEVHYEDGEPAMYREVPVHMCWTSEDGPDAGTKELARMAEALERPVLPMSMFKGDDDD